MAKVHNIGNKRFMQIINFPVKWEGKVMVRGWTQEIEEPFRFSTPLIVRLPKHKALVYGKWIGQQSDEEKALKVATQGRVLKDEDFEKGWEKAAWSPHTGTYQTPEEDFWATDV